MITVDTPTAGRHARPYNPITEAVLIFRSGRAVWGRHRRGLCGGLVGRLLPATLVPDRLGSWPADRILRGHLMTRPPLMPRSQDA